MPKHFSRKVLIENREELGEVNRENDSSHSHIVSALDDSYAVPQVSANLISIIFSSTSTEFLRSCHLFFASSHIPQSACVNVTAILASRPWVATCHWILSHSVVGYPNIVMMPLHVIRTVVFFDITRVCIVTRAWIEMI